MYNQSYQKQQNQQPQQQISSNEDDGANDYGSVEYWQNRYIKTQGQRFDWLENYQTLKQLIIRLLGNDSSKKILNVGCGNGEIQDYLYSAGFEHITNNDISKQVIKQMNAIKQQKCQQNMIYEVMDVTCMTYTSKSFDLVLDKSTIDALLCSQHPFINTALMLQNIDRVLKDDGIYLAVSYSGPQNRVKHLQRKHVGFQVQIQELRRENSRGDVLVHYAYICRKSQVNKNKNKDEKYKWSYIMGNNKEQKLSIEQKSQKQQEAKSMQSSQINIKMEQIQKKQDEIWRSKFYEQLKKQQEEYYDG